MAHKSKFDEIYQEALLGIQNPQQNGQNPQVQTVSTSPVVPVKKQPVDANKIGLIAKKIQDANAKNQPLSLTPDELEVFGQMFGGTEPEKSNTPQTPNPNQTLEDQQKKAQSAQIPTSI